MSKQNWVWMPHAAHFCGASNCHFRMATFVGNYIVSTVGEYYISGSSSKPTEIGWDRLYETFVFKAEECDPSECGCAAKPSSFSEIDSLGANDAKTAYDNHIKLCEEWSKK